MMELLTKVFWMSIQLVIFKYSLYFRTFSIFLKRDGRNHQQSSVVNLLDGNDSKPFQTRITTLGTHASLVLVLSFDFDEVGISPVVIVTLVMLSSFNYSANFGIVKLDLKFFRHFSPFSIKILVIADLKLSRY